ncbi:MAG: HNH endonuclease [Cyanobacteriota bacterium]
MATRPTHLPRLRRRKIYTDKFREEIRQDCQRRCVYCDIHEMEAGGKESMTLDHLRPQKKYAALQRDPKNLLWACLKCNNLKGDDWPAYGLADGATINGEAGYIDPLEVDRRDYFELMDDGSFKARKVPAAYIIYSLALNRPFLRYIRRRRDLIYESLLLLEKHFEAEIEVFSDILKDETVSDLDKGRWLQERKRFEAFLELVLALDETFSLP